jgi:hypothetical protein
MVVWWCFEVFGVAGDGTKVDDGARCCPDTHVASTDTKDSKYPCSPEEG